MSTHDGALGGRVTPWLIVRREDAQVTTTDELMVVQGEDRRGRRQELGMVDNLDA